jgi:hypothetical protein
MESLFSWPAQDAAEYTPSDIVRWWERRRLHFNLYVGAIGVITWLLLLIAGSSLVKPGEDFAEPFTMLFGPILYAIVANICYTAGWIVDTLAFRGRPRVGLYKNGVILSVVLTALPGAWALAAGLTTSIIGHKLG